MTTVYTREHIRENERKKAEIRKKLEEIAVRKTGYNPVQLANFTEEEENDLLVKKNKSLPVFKVGRRFVKLGRGNPLLSKRKFRTIEYINSRIEKMCK